MKSGSWNFKEYWPLPMLKPHRYVVSDWRQTLGKAQGLHLSKPSANFKAGGFLFLNIKIYFRRYYLLKEGIYNA